MSSYTKEFTETISLQDFLYRYHRFASGFSQQISRSDSWNQDNTVDVSWSQDGEILIDTGWI